MQGTIDTCTQGNQSKYWGVEQFQAQYPIYVIDASSDFFDAYACLYSTLTANPPVPCPPNQFVQCGDVGDLGPVSTYTTVGGSYSWVQFSRLGTGVSGM